MAQPKRYTVTSALPYANGPLHLGHLAGAYLPADIYVRYLRLMGNDVAFICGSDEHGAAIPIRAKKEDISPQDIIDKYHKLNKSTFEKLGISFDYYHRTSAELHHETAQEFFKKLVEKGGEFEEKTSEQYYDEETKMFLADQFIIGTCPSCASEEAYGNQCEKCGKDLSPTELINPKSTLSGKQPTLKETKHWYFKLDKHNDWLKQWIKDGKVDGVTSHNPRAWKKHVVGQCMSWLDEGLRPRAITRDLDWGIPVPVEGADGKVLYVWFDAPIGYISATKQWAKDNGKNWEDYWKSEDTQLVHFIGKDNIVFHCLVFPAMLKAHGEYNLPVNVPANQFLNFEGRKFSKSKEWGIEQHAYLEDFKDFENKEDALRYALIRNMPENRDADFKWDDYVEFYDKELADNLGNFVNRVIVLTNKYFDGVVPETAKSLNEVVPDALKLVQNIQKDVENFVFKGAVNSLMELSSLGNTYLQDVSPWKLFKTEPDSPVIKECLVNCIQIVGLISLLSEPFVPWTANKIRSLLNLENVKNGDLKTVIDQLSSNKAIVSAGHKVNEPSLLFAKIQDRNDSSRLDMVNKQKEHLAAILAEEKANAAEPLKEETTFEDFTKMDIRTGTILSAEPIKKADKLLKLEVDLGFEKRTVVSGIAQHYKPEAIIGQQVLLLANLKPRKLRGVESQGMILMAEDKEGKLSFVSPADGVGNGFTVR